MSSVSHLHKLACDLAFRCTSADLLTAVDVRPETRNFDRRTISIATVPIVWLVASSKASRILVKLVLKSARIMHS